MYDIIVMPPVEGFIRKLRKEEQIRLLDAIGELSKHPRLGKELVGKLTGLRSRRLANYRIIYRVEDLKLLIIVLRAGYRNDTYSKNFREK